MATPRIGRPDLLRTAPAWDMRSPRSLPPRRVDEIAAEAARMADGVARLTVLAAALGRTSRRDPERLARLHSLQDRAFALWLELAQLARETREGTAP